MPRTTAYEIVGLKFGRLTVLEKTGRMVSRHALYRCQCDCGNEALATSRNLRKSHGTRSCGCWKVESIQRRSTKHGNARVSGPTREYRAWASMVQRCYDPAWHRYRDYGARGITVCDRWRLAKGFEHFLADMGQCRAGLQLERIDNHGHYEPSNCRWATIREQQRNKRTNFLVTLNGETKPLVAWCEERGLNYFTVWSRIRVLGWIVERALAN